MTQARQAQLRVGRRHQPGPKVSLRGIAHAGRHPVERPFEEPERLLAIVSSHVRSPEEREVGRARPLPALPPQPQDLRFARLAG